MSGQVNVGCSLCVNVICAMVASCLAQQPVTTLNRQKGDMKGLYVPREEMSNSYLARRRWR
jgi:hypothetical protein